MKKAFFILLFALIVLSVSVFGYNTTVPTTVKVNVEFVSPTHFYIQMPNGLEKHFDWSNTSNVTPPDESFTHTVYTVLDPEAWCGSNTALYQYKNLTSSFLGLTDICSDSMTQYNKTLSALVSSSESEKKYITCSSDLNSTKTLLDNLREKEQTFDDTMSDYLSCQTGYANCKSDQDKLAICSDDLTKSNSDKNTYAFVAGAAGLLAGWFLWKRKKPVPVMGPSDQGSIPGGDFVNMNPSDVRRRSDGINKEVWKRFEGDGGNN